MLIRVSELIGKNAVTQRAGLQLYEAIHGPISRHEEVDIDFGGVAVYSSPFFNNSIGRLFADLDENTIRRFLLISNISATGTQVLRRVIDNAKSYYSMTEQERSERDRINGAFFDALDQG